MNYKNKVVNFFTQTCLNSPTTAAIKSLCNKSLLGLIISLSPMALQHALATQGFFSHCSGPMNCGTGGAGAAFPTSAIDGLVNPSLLSKQENNVVVSLGLLHVNPTMDSSAAQFGNKIAKQTSTLRNFPDASAGVLYKLPNNLVLGLSLGSGGIGTKYNESRTPIAFQSSPPFDKGIMYRLFVLAPSLSGQVSDTSSLGISMQMGYSDFKTDTALPAPNGQGFVQTKGLYKRQSSFGVGWRIGLTWDASELLTLGASYATPIRFKKFTKYNDVFSGPMDTPENFVVGSAWHLARNTDFLLDVKQVRYKQVKTLGRLPSNNGFGWSNQTIFMAGITQRFDAITGRLGYSYGKSPIKSDRTFANALAPAIAEQHFTAGLSYKSSEKIEWFSNVWCSPKKAQTDPGTGDMFSKGGKDTKISMHQYGFSLGAKYAF